ncbi:interferon-induced transmembrane protein-domain-containing protein [Tribonema minus]|uniref:Interferon-induced transmembrane protein-domain-containing protein n=1 Tax=Tribonema minus TaxID=303371 RepID=A0A835YJY0_9STRA|nr:interferon-induced transmembrane protein-domain-containing protein [Tribonema minus]
MMHGNKYKGEQPAPVATVVGEPMYDQAETGTVQHPVGMNQQQPYGLNPTPPRYTCASWFTCLCCCWPVGLAAVLTSCVTRDKIRKGDAVGAQKCSRITRILIILATVLGIMMFIAAALGGGIGGTRGRGGNNNVNGNSYSNSQLSSSLSSSNSVNGGNGVNGGK